LLNEEESMNSEENNQEMNRMKKEIKSLRGAIEELTILNEIAIAISSTMSLDHMLKLITDKCLKHLKVEQAAILLLEKQTEGMPFKTMIRLGDDVTETFPFRLDTQLAGWMLKHKQPLIVNDFSGDERFKKRGLETFPVKSLACVPLITQGRMIGLIALFNKVLEEGFTPNDKRVLSIIATQSAQVIENARLLKEEQAFQRVQEELRMAYDIQINLLPKEPPVIGGYDIVGKSIPAKEVGGDYFDFIPMSDNRLGFCLGDVSGKGMPAALLMSNLQATVHSQVILNAKSHECLDLCNTLMYQNTDPEKFATFFMGILDQKSGEISFANAGHNFPVLFSGNKEPQRLESGGIVLGCLEDFSFKEQQVRLAPDDLLLIYSDGITEAINDQEEEFGESRLIDVINNNRQDSSKDLITKIITAVVHHAGDLPQMDDITLMIIRREK
jgi:sigma-B regulation protein RsbU (phosphoserine phosphatase)